MHKIKQLSVAVLSLVVVTGLNAQTPFAFETESQAGVYGGGPKEVTADIVVDDTSNPVRVGVEITVFDGGHIYGKSIPEGQTGLPTELIWKGPDGIVFGPVSYPPTTEFTFLDESSRGYAGKVTLWSEVYRSKDIDLPIELSAAVSWLVCDDVSCIPGDASLSATLEKLPGKADGKVGEALTESDSIPDKKTHRPPPEFSLGILLAAFLGGLILNIMPCVLPVIGIKVLSFVEHAGESPSRQRLMGWGYAAGVMVSFWALALVVILLQIFFSKVVLQGFQLEDPRFVFFMILLIFTMGLSMLGVFHFDVGSGVYQSSSKLAGKEGLGGAFFNGFLAVVLSTPCSAPILGTALGFAFAAPPLMLLLTFTFIGAGLAFPFVLLTYVPAFLNKLPKPGAWMDHFKQAMGFVMLGFSVWLLGVFFKQTDVSSGVWLVGFLVAVSVIAWIFGRFHGPVSSSKSKIWARVLMVAILVISWLFIVQGRVFGTPPDHDWVDFKNGGLKQALASDQPVFVDVTAAWCISCKANESAFINVPSMRKRFKEQGIIAVKADRTKPDPEVVAYLQSFGRAGVPMYVVYGKDRDNPDLLPEALTGGLLNEALDEAVQSFQQD